MWTSAGPADRHSWRPKPGPTSPPSADRRRPGTRGARPPARRSRWAPTPADRPGPGRLPARSWCVAHPGGPVKPPAVPRAARRIRPSRCRPRKPADRGARPGRHRGAPDSNWAMRRRTAGLPPAAARSGQPSRESSAWAGAAPSSDQQRISTLRLRTLRTFAVQRRTGDLANRRRPFCGQCRRCGFRCRENHQLGRCKLLGAARIGGLTSRVCTAARLSGIRNSMPGRSRGGSLRGFPPGSGIAADARARLQPMPGEQPTHE